MTEQERDYALVDLKKLYDQDVKAINRVFDLTKNYKEIQWITETVNLIPTKISTLQKVPNELIVLDEMPKQLKDQILDHVAQKKIEGVQNILKETIKPKRAKRGAIQILVKNVIETFEGEEFDMINLMGVLENECTSINRQSVKSEVDRLLRTKKIKLVKKSTGNTLNIYKVTKTFGKS